MHRDLRWANVACTPAGPGLEHKYYLIDLEMAGCAGPWRAAVPLAWDKRAVRTDELGDSVYDTSSDCFHLGLMMLECAKEQQFALSPAAEDLARRLMREPPAGGLTAAAALQAPWIGCQGHGCTAAGCAI